MSYTKALYYPTIDIENSNWMKSSVLFWDKIQTIVPEEINEPYKNLDSKILEDNGLLSPFILNKYSPLMKDFGDEIIQILETEEGHNFLAKGKFEDSNFGILAGKIPISLEHIAVNRKRSTNHVL